MQFPHIYFCVKTLFICIIVVCNNIVLANSESDKEDDAINSHDFIIVGGGLSGCVVAGRLSEKHSVVLLEAGGKPTEVLDIPATVYSLADNYTKVYKSVPQLHASIGTNNGQVEYRIGELLGGGSSVNGMVFNRGSPHDYDNWANVTNDSSWEYSNLLKYFKRVEDYQGNFPSSEHHGRGGPIPISVPKYAPGLEEWMQAGEYLGYPSRFDPNGPQQPGFAPLEFSRRQGRRVSAYSGYVKPFLKTRPNLKVLSHVRVTRILFNDEKNAAIGVTYTKKQGNGIMITTNVFANKEVILSAGTMDSAAILMKSGIGPLDVLQDSNIRIVNVLPVGYNLQDHMVLKLDIIVDNDTSRDVLIPERDLTPESWKIYEESGDGPYSSLSGFHGMSFLVSSVRKEEEAPQPDWADVQIAHMHSPGTLHVVPEMQEEEEHNENQLTLANIIVLTRPKSRGRLILNSSDVDAMPLIDFQYLSHPDDMSILVDAMKLTVNLYENTPAFQKLGARYSQVPYAPCKHLIFRSDDYWQCYIGRLAVSAFHAGGTCRMGQGKLDNSAVVDSQLKVIGIEGLRVVDLSIMPNVTNSNTQAPAYVIAEKASDMILNEWRVSSSEHDEGDANVRRLDEL